jgi:hypothetical protein
MALPSTAANRSDLLHRTARKPRGLYTARLLTRLPITVPPLPHQWAKPEMVASKPDKIGNEAIRPAEGRGDGLASLRSLKLTVAKLDAKSD